METSKLITVIIIFIITALILLISKFKPSKQHEINRKIKLLPFWMKYLGIVISISSIIIHWNNLTDKSTIINSFWQFGLIIGLLLICLSKEKNEDEMIMSLRLDSVFLSFFGGIIAHILFILIDLLYGGNTNSYSSLYITGYILIVYLANFYHAKRKMYK